MKAAKVLTTFTKIALASILSTGLAMGGGWEHALGLTTSAEQDSNPAMLADSVGSVWRARLNPRYSLAGTFGRDDYSATLGLWAEESSDEGLSNRRQDYNGSLSWGHAFDTGSVRFNARADEASTRSTEFEDSGLVSRESTKSSYALSLGGQDSLSEKASLSVGAGQSGAKYEDAALRNYANQTAEVGLGYALSETLGTTARLAATEFDPDGPGVPSKTYSVSFGVSVQSGARFNWGAQYGFRHTVADTKNNGSDGLLSLQWKDGTDDISVAASRQLSPSSIGSMSVVDGIKAAWQSHWGPRSRSLIDLSLTKRHGAFETEMALATAAFVYDPWDATNVRIYLQEKRLDRANSVASATIIGASLTYNWRP